MGNVTGAKIIILEAACHNVFCTCVRNAEFQANRVPNTILQRETVMPTVVFVRKIDI
jgi:hypothetical protein